jgi:hypothetical protein
MPIQQLSCNSNHLSIPVHLSPCRSHLCSRTSTEGAAVITGTGWRRGGGPATWARWSMARASASTLDGFARSQGRADRLDHAVPATTSRAQWGCIGAPNGATDERCRTGRRRGEQAAQRTARGRRATGILKLERAGPWRPAPLLFDSAIVRGPEAPGDRARHRPFSSLFAVLYRRVPRPLVVF